ncbi:MAG: hypothetical protein AB7V77_04955 [Candidatus Woesearchaeota archaeon]
MNKSFILLLFLLILPLASASTIQGKIYNLDFQRVTEGIVTINTEPLQTYILEDGTYTFQVPKGTYIITATQYQNQYPIAEINQTINLNSEGTFNLDLIVYPIITTEFEDIENIDVSIPEDYIQVKTSFIYYILALILFMLFLFIYKKHYEKIKLNTIPDELEKNIIKFIQEEKTTSQLDIRNKFPQYSEAKISLVITKLEKENKIKKIKHGRANIISIK